MDEEEAEEEEPTSKPLLPAREGTGSEEQACTC